MMGLVMDLQIVNQLGIIFLIKPSEKKRQEYTEYKEMV